MSLKKDEARSARIGFRVVAFCFMIIGGALVHGWGGGLFAAGLASLIAQLPSRKLEDEVDG